MTDFDTWSHSDEAHIWVIWFFIDPNTGERKQYLSEKMHAYRHIEDMVKTGNSDLFTARKVFDEYRRTGQPVTFSTNTTSKRARLARAWRAVRGGITDMYFEIHGPNEP